MAPQDAVPSRRQPMRSERVDTRKGVAHSVSNAALAGSVAITRSVRRAPGAAASHQDRNPLPSNTRATDGASPNGISSPVRRARPARPANGARTSVDRLPSTRGTAKDPPIETYARAPV